MPVAMGGCKWVQAGRDTPYCFAQPEIDTKAKNTIKHLEQKLLHHSGALR
jgi:hypothetical protein